MKLSWLKKLNPLAALKALFSLNYKAFIYLMLQLVIAVGIVQVLYIVFTASNIFEVGKALVLFAMLALITWFLLLQNK